MNWIDYKVQPFPTDAEHTEQFKHTYSNEYLGVVERYQRKRLVKKTVPLSLWSSQVHGNYWTISDEDETIVPLYWMPLPKPPTEDTKSLDEDSS